MVRDLSSDQIVDYLNKVLKSRTFEKSERARDLLKYIVEQDLAGKASDLKGFAIAVDVFGKDENFEATTDPLVRIHAGRLRELLAAYYKEEGIDDAIEISIPLGGYKPHYLKNLRMEVLTKSIADDPKGQSYTNLARETVHHDFVGSLENKPGVLANTKLHIARLNKSFWIILGTLVLVGGLLVERFYFHGQMEKRLAQPTQYENQNEIPRSSLLPVIRIATDAGDEELVRFSEKLLTELAKFETIITLKLSDIETAAPQSDRWPELYYGFNILRVGGEEANPTVKVELIRLREGKVLRAEEYPANVWNNVEAQTLIARKLTGIGTPEGLIYADIAAKGSLNPVLDCLIKVRNYYGSSNLETHKAAYDCSGNPGGNDGASGLLKAVHGGLMAEAVGKGFAYDDLSKVRSEALSAALIVALEGVNIAPASARSAREVGFVYSLQGAIDLMNKWFAHAYELNPNDTSIAASFGYGLVLSGEYANAISVLEPAISATPLHPNWWNQYLSLAFLMENQIDKASDLIRVVGLKKRTLFYLMLNTVFAHQKNETQKAEALTRELREKYPKFAGDPRSYFEKRRFPPDLIIKLVESLTRSGI